MKIYFIANSIYQFAYALPLYRKTGGTFVVTSSKKMRHFNRYLKRLEQHRGPAPGAAADAILVPRDQLHTLKGILLFFANTISPEQNYADAICCFHEHGTSDKRYEGGDPIAIAKLNKYDYLLLSGPKNKHRLLDIGVEREAQCLIETGCLRFEEYRQGRFTREKAAEVLGIKDLGRKNILYAPTWKFGNGTFRQYAAHLIEALTPTYNLILRPHYHDRRYGAFLYWMARLKGQKNVYFSHPQDVLRHDTYSAFAISDLLISDISSVIYEYLITLKPIVLIANDFEQRHRMPPEMDIAPHVDHYRQGEDLLGLVSKNLERAEQDRAKYHWLLNHCFYQTEGGAAQGLASFLDNLKTGR
jgi:hypothetical protein